MLIADHQLTAVGMANGEGWLQAGELGLALLLSAVIGLEREMRQKNAGLRTYTLVGIGSALFMLISKYGFTDVLEPGRVVLDPSRVAAQIVTGIGFLGAGIIFVRQDSVRGLTTAAGVWVTAAVGAAAGAGLPVLAAVSTGVYLVVALAFPLLTRHLPRSATAMSIVRVRYPDGQGMLREVLKSVTAQGFAVDELSTAAVDRVSTAAADSERRQADRTVEVTLQVHGRGLVNELAAGLSEMPGVQAVLAGDAQAGGE
jgi:putative Mg2+ transporter-C (MgtC) family protein